MKPAFRKILVVDDDDIFRERLVLSLSRRGHEVTGVDSVAEALIALETFCPEAAILDLKMPGENGLALVPLLQKINPQIQILVLTGYGSIPSAVDAIRLGAANYLTKPADTNQILNALEQERASTELDSVPSLDRVEWEHLQRVLSDCNHNISKAARLLGIERRTLQRKLQKFPPLQ